MSKTFDALQRVMIMREALKHMERGRFSPVPPPGGKMEQDASREKEVRSMGTDDSGYPPLDRRALWDGYRLCVGNATRLIADARGLRDAGHCRSAYLILLLAVEELGTALQLYEAGHAGVQDWEAWWSRYFSHPKTLESTVLDLPREEQADERFSLVREELVYVDFDKKDRRFKAPRDDDDTELLQLFDQEAGYAEGVLKALPAHALERWEFEELMQQSPEIARSVLYALIAELVSQEPTVSAEDLLRATARDLAMPLDDLPAGFELWKNVAPKTRAYVDLLWGEQDKLGKETGGRKHEIA